MKDDMIMLVKLRVNNKNQLTADTSSSGTDPHDFTVSPNAKREGEPLAIIFKIKNGTKCRFRSQSQDGAEPIEIVDAKTGAQAVAKVFSWQLLTPKLLLVIDNPDADNYGDAKFKDYKYTLFAKHKTSASEDPAPYDPSIRNLRI